MKITYIDKPNTYLPISSLLAPMGFYTYSTNLGIKDDTLDFTIIYSTVPAHAAAMFTQNHFCGAPIHIGKENVANGVLRCIVVNSKNANVATGEQGIANVREITTLIAKELEVLPEDILPASTGVIGKQLPMERMKAGIPGIKEKIYSGGFDKVAEAMMTTDTYPKIKACKIGQATLIGVAKGSGMIEPNMATLLAYFMTDAELPKDFLTETFHKAINQSFNMVSIDTDTSTSDMAAIMANGLAGKVDLKEFENALIHMAIDLAKEIAKDGEGATKLLEVVVDQAANFKDAKRVAKAVVNSPLVKTAVFGTDPNWGRVAMAIGKCELDIIPEKISISFGDLTIYNGKPCEEVDLQQLKHYLQEDSITINISLGVGEAKATVWGCDLSYDYVQINGEYTT
ncbi:bifunctional glutamate N-acetyltransferase/amino-acid acetyltransferase ArgJ [Peribacillus asahii]|uniref:bifunctional glutamate N-acetyltransferase/amino-acid acetyltransferase ArgJ n=1 Tax=Peribacillus asahii TaxID=228899 RepID=UPI00380696B1